MTTKLPSFEKMYPTKHAREIADEAFDKLPLSTPLGECIYAYRTHQSASSAGTFFKRYRAGISGDCVHALGP